MQVVRTLLEAAEGMQETGDLRWPNTCTVMLWGCTHQLRGRQVYRLSHSSTSLYDRDTLRAACWHDSPVAVGMDATKLQPGPRAYCVQDDFRFIWDAREEEVEDQQLRGAFVFSELSSCH